MALDTNWELENVVGDCFMINIYGPRESSAKFSLWNRIAKFMHHHHGKFILFGDMNTVRHENERFGSLFSRLEADHFNSFIDSSGLIDLPIGDRYFTWMNKAGKKLSKLHRFLFSKEILEVLHDIHITALDRMLSDHTPILLHVLKSDLGPNPFKFYNSWLLRDGFDEVVLTDFKDIEKRIDDETASPLDRDKRIKLLQDIDKLDNLEAFDLIQKAHIKWDIEGDENSKFFHGLINHKRRSQAITGLSPLDGNSLEINVLLDEIKTAV
ncbi:RNA-directed DNA polymerase, eukaryota [Artemisia annua]|uniref:RNA-directed DNA polymerase, eukaryota n=1 Tax=Artemisia annua TaxID=35608 RepID=A0A2U1NN03_ARTAN|nr:RNA-directed DNA polymerase, eukaryota [Artemisia annua]